ncbi:MAG: amino acid ABC transporter substrate-binding protein [Betaproteobacteria bacterium]|nr:amino acid ABC transporter substrate-binding protein [Betaproteobacteria bacterium]
MLVGVVLGASPGLWSQAWAQSKEPIRIGVVFSLTGPGAGLGQAERNGAVLAEKVINERGGIKGRPLKLLVEDDGSKADIAKVKAEGLIFNEKVKAIVGPSLTASTGAIAAITHAQKLPQIACTGLGPAIELTYKSLFHVMPPQALNAKAMLEYASKELKAKKVGVLHDSGYGQLVTNALKEAAPAYGVELATIEKFEVGATDVSTQAAKVRAGNPDAVFVIATNPTPFRNARQMRITQVIVSAIGSSAYQYVNGMGEHGHDIVFPEFLVAEDPLPHQKDFVELYKKAYNALPKNYEAAGWDAVHMLARALEKVGPDANSETLAKALREPYKGELAAYNFGASDMTGIELSSYVYSKLVKGKFTRLPFTAK